MNAEHKQLPGFELIEKGLADFKKGIESSESYLVKIGSYNLAEAGLLPQPCLEQDLELNLYRHLSRIQTETTPHAQYKALIDRLDKFEHALLQLN